MFYFCKLTNYKLKCKNMNKILFLLILIFSFSSLKSQNIVIDKSGSPNEPSIVVNPNNPNQLVAGSNITNCYYSDDSGITWKKINLNSTYGVWGDPCVVSDKFGDFYFFHLSNPSDGNWVDRIVCQKSVDGGKTWNNGSFAGLNGTKVQDKHWVSIDKKNNFIYTTWTQFDVYESKDPKDSSRIMFSHSEDAGVSWSAAQRISQTAGDCVDDDYTVEGAVPAVGPDGQIYVSWAGRKTDGSLAIMFDKSIDKGKSWLKNDIFIADFPGGWTYDIPGIYRANGMPVTLCDTSGGPNHGTIYVNWSDQKNCKTDTDVWISKSINRGKTDTDVWLSKSTDQGETWSKPLKVNDDLPGKHQFFNWIAIDPVTGFLYVVFYDRRNYNDNQTDVYIAYSTDGGETFINKKISDKPFLPSKIAFFGDYSNITAFNGMVYPIWTRADGYILSILTAKLNFGDTLKLNQNFYDAKTNFNIEKSEYSLNYTVRKNEKISLSVFNSNDKLLKTVINESFKTPGNYTETFINSEKSIDMSNAYWLILSDKREIKIKIE